MNKLINGTLKTKTQNHIYHIAEREKINLIYSFLWRASDGILYSKYNLFTYSTYGNPLINNERRLTIHI